jgi:hypothetical protein
MGARAWTGEEGTGEGGEGGETGLFTWAEEELGKEMVWGDQPCPLTMVWKWDFQIQHDTIPQTSREF